MCAEKIAMYIIDMVVVVDDYLKRKQKRERVLSMDLLYAHIGVRCGNTVIIVVCH